MCDPLARIFFSLAVLAVLLLSINLVLGYRIGDLHGEWTGLARIARELNDEKRKSGADQATIEQLTQRRDEQLARLLPVRRQKETHFWVGLIAALVTILLNSVSVTYFIGTTRWCQEVIETYKLDDDLGRRSRAIKRRAFPWALGGSLLMITLVALGAASDPSGYLRERSGDWVLLHGMLGILTVAFCGWSFLVQVGQIGANYDVIEAILQEVEKIRQGRAGESASDSVARRSAT